MKIRYYLYHLWVIVSTVFFAFLQPPELTAQANANLRVLVISEAEGTPIAGANVILQLQKQEEYKIIKAGATDKDGFQEFRDISPGQYRLKVTFVGYKTYLQKVSLQQNQTKIEEVILSQDIEQLEEVLVESEREVTAGNVGLRRISGSDLGRIPTPGPSGDLASYLQTLPGVIATGDRGGDLFIRGGTPEQNKVLVDNLPIVKPFHISNIFSAFPEQNIQNIDMYAGGFGAEYMGATSAIMDISLKPGNMKEYAGSASLGSHLVSLQVEGPIKTGQESFMISARKSMIEQSAPYMGIEDTPIDFYDLIGRYSYQSEDFYCNITGIYTYDQGQINPSRNLKLSWGNTAIGGRCRGFSERYNHPFEVTAGYTSYTNTEGTRQQVERSSSIRKMYINVDLEEEFWGLSFDYGFGMKLRFVSAELAEPFTNIETFENMNLIPHLYIATEIEPNKYFTFKPSIGSQITWGTTATLEPRLRAVYYPDGSNRQEVSLALGKYTQDLNGISDQRDAGTVFTLWKPTEQNNPTQSVQHGILSYKQMIGESFNTSIEGYVKDHKKTLVSKWTPVAGLETETSFTNGSTYGFDLRVEYENHPFYLYLGYGWSKIKYEADSDNLGAWIKEPIFEYSPAHDQRHKFNTIATYNFQGFTTSLSWEFGSGKPYTKVYGFDLSLNSPANDPLNDAGTARALFSRPYSERLPTYHRLDASIKKSFDFSPNLSVNAKIGCINIYNRNNIFYFDLNSLERVNQTPFLPYFTIETKIN